jgi:signal transduction histidine kinase
VHAHPSEEGLSVYFRDITERKNREKEQEKFNRTLRALSKSNQAMMRATDECGYMESVCNIIVEDCGHAMVWIGFAEEDEAKMVRPVAHSGFEEGYIETLKITWADTDRGRGPTGSAIRTGKPSTCRNMLTDPRFKPWREEAIKRGYASSIVLPLVSEGKVFGALSIYSKDPDPFTEDEVKLLAELANDLSYGIMAIRVRAAHSNAEIVLKERTVQLEDMNKELESFSYSVSHDLRAPLRAISGYSKMIFRQHGDTFDENTRRQFNLIMDNARMMGQLIDDLLALARLGKEALSVSRLNMEDLTRDVWEELKANNPDRPIDLKIDHVPPGRGDRSLIKQVLVNILSNAIKFTRIREVPRIEVGGYREEKGNVYYVRDNGVGFDMQYHHKLFGVFQRLHGVAEYEGTGVGLAIVQRIIQRHGGRVWAESEVDKGATFYFSLPQK